MRILWVFLLFLNVHLCLSQTVSLPDANLRNKLIKSYPQVMQGNDLSITKAAALTGTLDLKNSNISDGTGLEYFTGIRTLDLTNNQLSTLPPISSITGLVNFYGNYNKLIALPDLSNLKLLEDFQIMGNQLTVFPNLAGASGLTSLYCSGNKFTQFPSLNLFPNLINLVIGDNAFKNIIDFSPCQKLVQLHVHKLELDTIIGLEKLKKLTTLYAWGNKIKTFSSIDSLNALTTCIINNNPMHRMPYLANKTNLTTLDVSECHLTFEDLLPLLKQKPPTTFIYSPQKNIPLTDISSREGNMVSLSYIDPSPSVGNWYVWLKNGIVIDSSENSIFTFNSLTLQDAGDYALLVYNSAAPNLVLTSDTIQITVKPCIEIGKSEVSILAKTCDKGYTINLTSKQISGGTAPLQYELINGTYTKKSSELVIDHLPAGIYTLIITDSKKCTATDKFVLNKIDHCDPVLTPNNDGIADTYFIEVTGKVKIYDVKKRLMNTLDAPIVWDGTDHNGNLLDAGYYFILQENESPIYISIIR